jgi:hypothetical protein
VPPPLAPSIVTRHAHVGAERERNRPRRVAGASSRACRTSVSSAGLRPGGLEQCLAHITLGVHGAVSPALIVRLACDPLEVGALGAGQGDGRGAHDLRCGVRGDERRIQRIVGPPGPSCERLDGFGAHVRVRVAHERTQLRRVAKLRGRPYDVRAQRRCRMRGQSRHARANVVRSQTRQSHDRVRGAVPRHAARWPARGVARQDVDPLL